MSLFRNGDLDALVGAIEIDRLVYSYRDNSNLFVKYYGSGFKDGNKTGDD